MKRIAVAGAVIAAIAIAGVYLLLTRGGDAPAPAATANHGTATPPLPTRRGGDDQRGEPRGLDVLLDDDPAGTLRLEGQVVDGDDIPIADATVVVDTVPPRTTTSEADGSFHVDALVGRPYELIARAPAGVAGPVTVRLTATSDPVVLRLRPAGAVEVTVVDAARREPVPGATVELRGIDTQTASTDAAGVARIDGVVPGGYRLAGYAPGYAMENAWIRVASADPRTATLTLRRGAAVSGTVRDPDGNPIAGAQVLYAGASSWARQADPRRDAVTTAADGAFRFEALPAGTFRFTARHRDHAPGSSEMITLDGSGERAGVDITLAAGAVLRGRVVSVDGEAMSSARVRVVEKTSGFIGRRPRQAFTGDDGRFEIRALPRAEIEVVALHETASSQTQVVDFRAEPHERDITIELTVTESIAGIVADSAGEPVEGAQVSAMPDFRRGGEFQPGRMRLRGIAEDLSDAGGRFELRGLSAGPYMVRASPPGAGSGRGGGGWVREPIEAMAGDRDVRITLDPDGAITGVVAVDDGTAPTVFTVSVGGFGGLPVSGAAFTVDDLPPREYTVTLRGVGFDTRQVSGVVVEPGKTTDLGTVVVHKGRALLGRVTADGQPVDGALVRAGQQIFGDGTSIKATAGRGPPGANNAVEATTDADGQFTLSGVVPSNMALIAEHPEYGRSRAVLIAGSRESVMGLDLALEPFGALEGRVVRAGEAVSQVIVNAQPVGVPGVSLGVASGDDGGFRFDRLAPGAYKLSAMVGTPMTGMAFHSVQVAVESGQTARADLAVEAGGVTLSVALTPTNADSARFAMVHVIRGAVTAATSAQLSAQLASLGEGFSSFALSFMGRPATVSDLSPGSYTACAVPFPAELTSRADMGAYMEREADRLPVFCVPHAVTASPDQQSVTVQVTLPAFVPGPDGQGDGQGDRPGDGPPGGPPGGQESGPASSPRLGGPLLGGGRAP